MCTVGWAGVSRNVARRRASEGGKEGSGGLRERDRETRDAATHTHTSIQRRRSGRDTDPSLSVAELRREGVFVQ